MVSTRSTPGISGEGGTRLPLNKVPSPAPPSVFVLPSWPSNGSLAAGASLRCRWGTARESACCSIDPASCCAVTTDESSGNASEKRDCNRMADGLRGQKPLCGYRKVVSQWVCSRACVALQNPGRGADRWWCCDGCSSCHRRCGEGGSERLG